MGTSPHIRVFDGVDQFELGNVSSSDGVDVAEAGIFAGILTSDEIAALGNGCPVVGSS